MVNFELYVIIDEDYLGSRDLQTVAREVIAGGATVIQLRCKGCTGRRFYRMASALREITREAEVTFIINDRVDIALAVGADGVHLGDEDLPISVARSIMGPNAIIGASTATPDEALEALHDGASYVGVGAIYATGTKSDAGEPIGPEAISRIREKCSLPVVGIGGINASNAAPCIRAGASGVAVISAILGSKDPRAATIEILEIVREARQSR